jgi:predicted alpha/beta hydrolase
LNSPLNIKEENIKIQCSDNTELAATLFSPLNNIEAAIIIGPATGIKRIFYASFANYLAENGFAVIAFDNRGIGDSLNGHVKKSAASLQTWGELDMPAVLEDLKFRFPNLKYHLIGHSAGGQLVGLMPNCKDFTSMVNFASSSGRIANMKFPFYLSARFFMNVFIPLNNLLFGYTNAQWLGMGEPLPKGVAQQWNQWCSGQGYVKTAFGNSVNTHWYDSINFPSLWINASDDDIAINKNVEDMLSVFKQLPAQTLMLNPKDYGLKEIGHMKFFSRKNKILWPLVLDWLKKY